MYLRWNKEPRQGQCTRAISGFRDYTEYFFVVRNMGGISYLKGGARKTIIKANLLKPKMAVGMCCNGGKVGVMAGLKEDFL